MMSESIYRKQGISLIVLIITIIIIIILAGTVILSISKNNPIDSAKKASFVNDITGFRDQLELYKGMQYTITLGDFNPNELQADDTSVTYNETVYSDKDIGDIIPALKDSKKYDGQFKIVDGKLVYQGTDTKKQEWASDNGLEVLLGSGGQSSNNANKPVLVSGLTAKKWSGSEWVTVSDPANDTSWYDYANKQWANAQTADGSMWVWIPRYEYKIPTLYSSTAQTILVNFLSGIYKTPTSGYIVHPAFTFGNTELTGIWVAKFEASGTIAAIDIKPNVKALEYITIDSMFTATRNMEKNSKYGWGTSGTGIDTHLMKNIEWGAIAYLSSSIYGKTGEVWKNPDGNSLTGRAGTSESVSAMQETYNYDDMIYGVNASTTGNIYGVYDMNGGSYEYTAAYVDSGDSSLTTYGLSLVNAEAKYKDVYLAMGNNSESNFSINTNRVGDAIFETSTGEIGNHSWYNDCSYMPYGSSPFFRRSGNCGGMDISGLFYFQRILWWWWCNLWLPSSSVS